MRVYVDFDLVLHFASHGSRDRKNVMPAVMKNKIEKLRILDTDYFQILMIEKGSVLGRNFTSKRVIVCELIIYIQIYVFITF